MQWPRFEYVKTRGLGHLFLTKKIQKPKDYEKYDYINRKGLKAG